MQHSVPFPTTLAPLALQMPNITGLVKCLAEAEAEAKAAIRADDPLEQRRKELELARLEFQTAKELYDAGCVDKALVDEAAGKVMAIMKGPAGPAAPAAAALAAPAAPVAAPAADEAAAVTTAAMGPAQ